MYTYAPSLNITITTENVLVFILLQQEEKLFSGPN